MNPRQHSEAKLRHDTDVAALKIIKETVETRGFPPSRRELNAELGYNSTSPAQRSLERLVEQGLVEVSPLTPRGIKITKAGMAALTDSV